MKRRLMCLWVILLVLFASVLPASAEGFDRSALEGVVVVYNEFDYGGDRYSGLGTGFFVGEEGTDPQYLVTNYHVVEYFIATGKSSAGGALVVFFDADTYEEAYVVDYNEEMDIAVLRLGAPTDLRKPLKLHIATEDMVGSRVYAVGYPGTSDAVGSISNFGTNDATVTDGTISRLVVQSGTGRRVIHTTAVIHGGNSGGPLVDENGAVLGLNTFSYINSETGESIEGSNYAVSVEELIPLLENNRVPYELWEDQSSLPVMWIAVGIGAIVVLVLVMAVIGNNKKKQQAAIRAKEAADKERLAREAAAQEEERRRKILEEEQHKQQKSPAVRSMSMQHGGMRVPLGANAITLGRNPATCKIVYKQNTPGVSKEHCSLRWDAQNEVFVLVDLKSTYGTFLMNGERLAPGRSYNLHSGDGFYLGDRVNELRVELG